MSDEKIALPTETQVNLALQVLQMGLEKSVHPQAEDLLAIAVGVIHDGLKYGVSLPPLTIPDHWLATHPNYGKPE